MIDDEPASPEVVSQISRLYAGNKEERADAVRSLVQTGKPAIGPLVLLLRDNDWRVRYRALEALGEINSENTVPDIVMLLTDEKDHVRYMAAKSLGKMRAHNVSAALIPLLHDENSYVRQAALDSFETIRKI